MNREKKRELQTCLAPALEELALLLAEPFRRPTKEERASSRELSKDEGLQLIARTHQGISLVLDLTGEILERGRLEQWAFLLILCPTCGGCLRWDKKDYSLFCGACSGLIPQSWGICCAGLESDGELEAMSRYLEWSSPTASLLQEELARLEALSLLQALRAALEEQLGLFLGCA